MKMLKALLLSFVILTGFVTIFTSSAYAYRPRDIYNPYGTTWGYWSTGMIGNIPYWFYSQYRKGDRYSYTVWIKDHYRRYPITRPCRMDPTHSSCIVQGLVWMPNPNSPTIYEYELSLYGKRNGRYREISSYEILAHK